MNKTISKLDQVSSIRVRDKFDRNLDELEEKIYTVREKMEIKSSKFKWGNIQKKSLASLFDKIVDV